MGEQLISVDFINEMYRTFFVWIDIVLASALTKEANSFIGLSQYIVMMFPPREITGHYNTKILYNSL